jgi:hypothetical protein
MRAVIVCVFKKQMGRDIKSICRRRVRVPIGRWIRVGVAIFLKILFLVINLSLKGGRTRGKK